VILFRGQPIGKFLLWMVAAALGVGQGGLIYYALFAGGGSPVLQVDTTAIDFGPIPSGVRVKREFHLTNVGASALVVRKIQAGCGCLEVNLTRNEIPPGKSEALQVTMTLESLVNKQVAIFVFSNDSRQPILKLMVRADAVMKSIVEPEVVDFGQVESTAQLPITKSFRLSLKQDYWDLQGARLSFTANEPYLRVDDSQPAHGNTKEIRLWLQKDAPVGDIATQLRISDATRAATIRILGHICGRYVALPQMIVLGPIGPKDEAMSESVAVKSRSGANGDRSSHVGRLSLGSLELSETLKGLLSVTKTQGAENSRITVTLNPAQYSGLWSSRDIYGHIRVECSNNGEDSEVLNVPVLVVLQVPTIRDE
jgi:hypothetical protein